MKPPPEIDGMEFIEELGRGGFAAVYRYRQRLPERDVAVKVFFDVGQREAHQKQEDNESHVHQHSPQQAYVFPFLLRIRHGVRHLI